MKRGVNLQNVLFSPPVAGSLILSMYVLSLCTGNTISVISSKKLLQTKVQFGNCVGKRNWLSEGVSRSLLMMREAFYPIVRLSNSYLEPYHVIDKDHN